MAAKKAKAPPTKKDRIGQFLSSDTAKSIAKRFGGNIVSRASEAKGLELRYLPTGITELDMALDGGFPAGRIHVVYGHKSGGKTTVTLKTLAQAQIRCANCCALFDECTCGHQRETMAAFIDVEGTFEPSWAKRHGIDMDRLILVKPEYAEQALDIAEALIESRECDILVIDSVAFLAPNEELMKAHDEATVGAQARIMGKGTRKFVTRLTGYENIDDDIRKPTIFLINQIREKVGVKYGSPEIQPGGKAFGFAATVELKMQGAGLKDVDSAPRFDGKTVKIPAKAMLKFKVTKNKAGTMGRSGELFILVDHSSEGPKGAFIEGEYLLSEGKKRGVIRQDGKTWKVGDHEFRVIADVAEALYSNDELAHEVRELLLEHGRQTL